MSDPQGSGSRVELGEGSQGGVLNFLLGRQPHLEGVQLPHERGDATRFGRRTHEVHRSLASAGAARMTHGQQ